MKPNLSVKNLSFIVMCSILILAAGSCTVLELARQGGTTAGEEIATSEAPDVVAGSPVEVSTDFSGMINRVQRTRRSAIANMSANELFSLGEPVLTATQNSVILNETTLQALRGPVNTLSRAPRTISQDEHRRISRDIERATTSRTGRDQAKRELNAAVLRNILLQIRDGNISQACGDLFNMDGDRVLLAQGDIFNVANMVCPEGSVFVILPGVHTGQMVEQSKNGNVWIGTENSVMDGLGETPRAFSGGLSGNTIRNLDIRNYTDHGIHSSGINNVYIRDNRFYNISPEKHGQGHGAVMFTFSENLEIRNNHFEDVASSIRFVDSRGPLQVLENSALNSGRNFFQCDKCNGRGIRVNRNSMEQTRQFGVVALEDWINIYQSNGEQGSPIQVNENRARGYGDSDSGSFMILGDSGGSHQEAVGNIGVNPGQVGIGVASGINIRVAGNKMYSTQWEHSNVAFYSANFYSTECDAHQFEADTNMANWRNARGQYNRSWADGRCGVSNSQIRSLVIEDRNMGPGIWNEWQ
jgi:hypothetical protein